MWRLDSLEFVLCTNHLVCWWLHLINQLDIPGRWLRKAPQKWPVAKSIVIVSNELFQQPSLMIVTGSMATIITPPCVPRVPHVLHVRPAPWSAWPPRPLSRTGPAGPAHSPGSSRCTGAGGGWGDTRTVCTTSVPSTCTQTLTPSHTATCIVTQVFFVFIFISIILCFSVFSCRFRAPPSLSELRQLGRQWARAGPGRS